VQNTLNKYHTTYQKTSERYQYIHRIYSISEKKRMKLNPLNSHEMEKCDTWKLSLQISHIYLFKTVHTVGGQWLMPIILPTWEALTEGINL
jgi:hypothetical protein